MNIFKFKFKALCKEDKKAKIMTRFVNYQMNQPKQRAALEEIILERLLNDTLLLGGIGTNKGK